MTRAVKRQYNSSRRDEQARETRLRIVRTAHDLFVAKGYGRTTIAEIAGAAGVAVETVYAAFRNKATLLRQAWFVTFRGDEEDVPLYDRTEMQAILAEPDLVARTLRHAEFVTTNNRRMAPLYTALVGAATHEPAAADLLAEYAERRLEVATKYARAAAATGQLAVSQAECRDVLFATMDGALWQRLVADRGWSNRRYAAWLANLWLASLCVSDCVSTGHPTSAPQQEGHRIRRRVLTPRP
jgi:TetR/AcrR family transcriptional regulator, regulator of autoinduction and epiphytic fitness